MKRGGNVRTAERERTIKRAIELNHYSYLNYLLFVKVIGRSVEKETSS